MKRLLILFAAILFSVELFSCTTAVISGKYTLDGRPMIWKLRDTETMENKLMYFSDGKFDCIGLVNSNDSLGENVWGGSNEAGFSIMNSASFNVNLDGDDSKKDEEGRFMKLALQTCENLKEFESLLERIEKPSGLAAHFGVLDAEGNVAFYEVNNYTYTKFDANDPSVAPNGYIIRTNYSFTGKKDVGYGFIRYQTAQDIFAMADAEGDMCPRRIIQDFSRCFKHAVLDRDFRDEYSVLPYGKNFINSGDLITRSGSSSMILIEGVKENEDADMSTIWTCVGFPNTSMVVPVWMRGGENLPKVMTGEGTDNSYLNQKALDLKTKCYPIERSAGYKYLQISELINAEKTGVVQRLELAEGLIFQKTQDLMLGDKSKKSIADFYDWIDDYVHEFYE